MVHDGGHFSQVGLFNCVKGQKLLADLLPLWPPPLLAATLLSLLNQLPLALATQSSPHANERSLAACLASVPKVLPPEACAKLLTAVTAHGTAAFKGGLERSDVTALLLGVLCAPGLVDSCEPTLSSFYQKELLPLAARVEAPWALLNATLPTASKAHAALLGAAVGALDEEEMAPGCARSAVAFRKRLEEHVAGLEKA